MREHRYYVYIVASRSRTLYIGSTSSLAGRIQQHKEGTYDGFSKQYQCNRLVHHECYDKVHRAIEREKQLKRWSRSKKIALIERFNAAWYDLSQGWGKSIPLGMRASRWRTNLQVSPLRGRYNRPLRSR